MCIVEHVGLIRVEGKAYKLGLNLSDLFECHLSLCPSGSWGLIGLILYVKELIFDIAKVQKNIDIRKLLCQYFVIIC